jgi:hypothetical protein
MVVLFNSLPDNMNEIRQDISGSLLIDYIDMGVETLAEHGRAGVVNYLYGTVGTIWTGTGLLQKPWTPHNYANMLALVEHVHSIVSDGGG